MAEHFKLNAKGEKFLEDPDCSPEAQLILWIVKNCPNIEKENCRKIWTQILEHYEGDAVLAIEAIKNGEASFTFTPHN